MRKYIVSDLHGDGVIYDSIMGYLDNIALIDDVELYINGDLIDRGPDGLRMLDDVIERINGKGDVKIHYLGGNHELMMYQALCRRKPNRPINPRCNWIRNGGGVIKRILDMHPNREELCEFYKNFLGELNLYKTFNEIINGNNILLVHAKPPRDVFEQCHLKIKDNNNEVEKTVWTREKNNEIFFFPVPYYKNDLSKAGYLVIKGHTPLRDIHGFVYDSDQNYINIDGGCACYVLGKFKVDHVPLLEIEDNRLSFTIFNHNNQIIDGYYFDGNVSIMDEEDLQKRDLFIDHKYDNCCEENKKYIKRNLDTK